MSESVRSLLSVVIPTRNRPDRLSKCLSSLMDTLPVQDRPAVFVIDDGSMKQSGDSAREICRQAGVTYEFLTGHCGVACARERGRRKCRSTWIAFLDDDVLVEDTWYHAAGRLLRNIDNGVVGVEGCVVPTGAGLWDREVQNPAGGKYLTCHCLYRREALENAGGFNTAFRHPFAEDHELAVRMLRQGTVVFAPALRVYHMPRDDSGRQRLKTAPKRIYHLLEAERRFHALHPCDYSILRHSDSFAATYRDILLKHTWISLRRRKPRDLLGRPVDALYLVAASLLEQLCAWILLFRYWTCGGIFGTGNR